MGAADIPYVWTIRPYGSFMGKEAEFLGCAMLSISVIFASGIFLWIGRILDGRWGALGPVCAALVFFLLIQNTTLAWASYRGNTSNESDKLISSDPILPNRGTFFFDGAGMQGPYIANMVHALESAGITNAQAVRRKDWSNGVVADVIDVFSKRHRDKKETDLRRKGNAAGQFNFIGYSYGGLQASQAAIDFADSGETIDFLVLVAAPISREFLEALKNHENIREVKIINFDGDLIKAGMSTSELVMSVPDLVLEFLMGKYGYIRGHFLLGGSPPVGNPQRKELARRLYEFGLR